MPVSPLSRNKPAASGFLGVFDSGIGGLSVANAVSGLLPREGILYLGDNGRAPYGPQPPENILAYSHEITRWLLDAGAKMIVVACNTATSIAIDDLRSTYPAVPFVGMEPAVKPAATGQRVGVMATAATLNSDRYLALKERYLAGRTTYENPCLGLVPLIEREPVGSERIRRKLRDILHPMIADGLDTLVLGCTHYPMIKADIEAVCGPGVRIIDPAPAAARQVQRLLNEYGLGRPPAGHEKNESDKAAALTRYDFCSTGNSQALQRALLSLPSLNANRRLLIPDQSLHSSINHGFRLAPPYPREHQQNLPGVPSGPPQPDSEGAQQ